MTFDELCKKKMFSRYKLSRASGISDNAIRNLERGIGTPRMETLRKLSNTLQVTPEELQAAVSESIKMFAGGNKKSDATTVISENKEIVAGGKDQTKTTT